MYIGQSLQVAYPSYTNIDDISGSFDGVTTSFALTVGGVAPVPAPLSSNQCMISVGGVIQRPDDTGTEGFRLSGGNIVFSSAPNIGEDFFGVILAGADYVNVGVTYPSGTAAAPSITFDTDLDTGIYNPAANQVGITTGGTSRLVVDSSGNVAVDTNTLYVDATNNRVGIGTQSPAETLHSRADNAGSGSTPLLIQNRSISANTSVGISFAPNTSDTADRSAIIYGVNSSGGSGNATDLTFHTNANGGSPTERARIDSSGRLLVGTPSAESNYYVTTNNYTPAVQIKGSALNGGAMAITGTDGLAGLWLTNAQNVTTAQRELGIINFNGYDGTNYRAGASIQAVADATTGSGDMPGRLVFSTTSDGSSFPTEAVRIDNSRGLFTYTNQDPGFMISTARGSGTTDRAIQIKYGATAINTGTVSFQIYTNGNVQNTNNSYGSISDLKLKENIVDANSQWDDLKALQVRNYNFKVGQTHTQIGLIAQEVELVSPGLVSESPDRDAEGNDLGTVTKSVNYSVLYMKAVKALQEAQLRIENLEAQNAQFEARLTALESA